MGENEGALDKDAQRMTEEDGDEALLGQMKNEGSVLMEPDSS